MNNNNNNIYFFFFFILDALIAAGGMVSAASGMEVMSKLLDSIGDAKRKIAISVLNETNHPWEAISVYFSSGTSDKILPLHVKKGTN